MLGYPQMIGLIQSCSAGFNPGKRVNPSVVAAQRMEASRHRTGSWVEAEMRLTNSDNTSDGALAAFLQQWSKLMGNLHPKVPPVPAAAVSSSI